MLRINHVKQHKLHKLYYKHLEYVKSKLDQLWKVVDHVPGYSRYFTVDLDIDETGSEVIRIILYIYRECDQFMFLEKCVPLFLDLRMDAYVNGIDINVRKLYFEHESTYVGLEAIFTIPIPRSDVLENYYGNNYELYYDEKISVIESAIKFIKELVLREINSLNTTGGTR